MKKFMDPEMEIVMFSIEDVIASSIDGDANVGGSGDIDWLIED